ncbi:hypothetical protein D3C79_128590 [compost metagenome]
MSRVALIQRAEYSAHPYNCVITPCSYARLGLTKLLISARQEEVFSLGGWSDWLALPGALRARPAGVFIYRLPETLGPLMVGLEYLQIFLSRRLRSIAPLQQVILISDVPPFWLLDTLKRLLPNDNIDELPLYLLSANSTPEQIRTELIILGSPALLSLQAKSVPLVCRRAGIKPIHVGILRDLLINRISIQQQARLAGISAKTRYSQHYGAMRKLGVHSLIRLIRWDARDWRGFR